jgi:hypothetical protein
MAVRRGLGRERRECHPPVLPQLVARSAQTAGASRCVARGRYPFASGAIRLVALTPSASAWKFITTR